MKHFTLFTSFLFFLVGLFAQDLSQKLDNRLYDDMFWVASGGENPSCGLSQFVIKPTQFFVVVEVTNKNTNETKQMTTLYQDLRSAVNMDRASSFDRGSRKVVLTNELALQKIGFIDYDLSQLKKIQEKLDYNDFYRQAKAEENSDFLNKISHEDRKYYAHILFNNGAMAGIVARTKQFIVYDKRATNVFKQELIDNLLPEGFDPDLKIGDVSLLEADHVESYFGEESMHHLTPMGEEGNEFAQVTILSRDKSEKLTLISHPGSADYEFAVFKVEKAETDDSEIFISKVGKFVSENGVRIGMSEEDFLNNKGNPSVKASKGENIKVYNYCIVENYDHKLLRENKMPGYFANYTFENGLLIAFEFGFVNP